MLHVYNCILTWDVSYASAVAHLVPPGRHIQLKECCGHGHEQCYAAIIAIAMTQQTTPPPNLHHTRTHARAHAHAHTHTHRALTACPGLYWDSCTFSPCDTSTFCTTCNKSEDGSHQVLYFTDNVFC